ncbi:hypothetical protein GALLR39Z86_49220 [Glycomyces algeriensis]|uniref:Uncharacterized protein n=1 Tax=Glycomyces algeriensis TaxID=256037 RepID=A0A9W6LIH0_9ACTN|nr:hypothetical protein GALLR39Z86_49220 [Glycomyces algeriensis]
MERLKRCECVHRLAVSPERRRSRNGGARSGGKRLRESTGGGVERGSTRPRAVRCGHRRRRGSIRGGPAAPADLFINWKPQLAEWGAIAAGGTGWRQGSPTQGG